MKKPFVLPRFHFIGNEREGTGRGGVLSEFDTGEICGVMEGPYRVKAGRVRTWAAQVIGWDEAGE